MDIVLSQYKENYYFFDKKERKERCRKKFFIVVENEERKKLPPRTTQERARSETNVITVMNENGTKEHRQCLLFRICFEF